MFFKRIFSKLVKYWFIYRKPYKNYTEIPQNKELMLKELQPWYAHAQETELQEKIELVADNGEAHFKSLKKARNNLERKTILLLAFLLSFCSFSCLKVVPLLSNLTPLNHYLALILASLSSCYLVLASWVVFFGFSPKIEANMGAEPRIIMKNEMIKLSLNSIKTNLAVSLQKKIDVNHYINEKWASYLSLSLTIAIALLAIAMAVFICLMV